MSPKKNPLFKFWNELKRRNVFRVIAMYAGASFVVIEVTNNIVEPLGLPPWTSTVVILAIIIGFPVTAILSWIFDITPEGVKKTEAFNSSSADNTRRRKLRTSDIIISVLIIVVGILVYPKIFNKDGLKDLRDQNGKISVAVMPFNNQTGDTAFNVWQSGLQNLLITTLSNSEEMSVRNYQAVRNVLESSKDVNVVSFTPSIKKDLAGKLETRTLITGNILKAGNKLRANAQLVDAETDEIYKTYQVEGNSEDDIFHMADTLSGLIKNYIEIRKISEQYNSPVIQGNKITSSSEAFKYYLHAYDAFRYTEINTAIDWFVKAIEIDSSFTNAYILLTYAYLLSGNDRMAKQLCKTAYSKRDEANAEGQLLLDQMNAYFFESPYEEIKYAKQLISLDEFNPMYWHLMGFAYYKLFEYEDAIKSYERALEIHEKWGTPYGNPFLYFPLADAYHKIGEHKKEARVTELGKSLFPNAILIHQYEIICEISQGNMEKAEELLAEYKSIRHNVLHCTEAMISTGVGSIYSGAGLLEEAENYYRKAIEQEPENLNWKNDFAWFLVDKEVNIEEGLELVEEVLDYAPEYWPALDTKGWGLYKLGRYEEALKLLKDSWDLKPAYSHTGYLHIQEVEAAVENQNVSTD